MRLRLTGRRRVAIWVCLSLWEFSKSNSKRGGRVSYRGCWSIGFRLGEEFELFSVIRVGLKRRN